MMRSLGDEQGDSTCLARCLAYVNVALLHVLKWLLLPFWERMGQDSSQAERVFKPGVSSSPLASEQSSEPGGRSLDFPRGQRGRAEHHNLPRRASGKEKRSVHAKPARASVLEASVSGPPPYEVTFPLW